MASVDSVSLWNKAITQNAVCSFMVGLGPGIYGVLTSLGAGGGSVAAIKMQNIANAVLYTVFFLGGFVSGAVVTTIGPRVSLLIGALGYPVFAGGLWYFTRYGHLGYPIFGGAFMGLSACLLWTSVGYIASSYSEEDKKGSYISMQFWILGTFSTIGSLVAFGMNYRATGEQCPDGVYITFIALQTANLFLALFFIRPPSKVLRSKTATLVAKVETDQRIKWAEQLWPQTQPLKDWRMGLLTVPFFASEMVLTVSSTVSAEYFNIRTRSLNTVAFNIFQILGSLIVQTILDGTKKIGLRQTRGITAVIFMSVIVLGGWTGLTAWLYRHPEPAPGDPHPPLYDWTDTSGAFAGFFTIELLLGINMAIYQIVGLWIMAALTNDPPTLARYSGVGKGCLAGGLAASFGIEASGISQLRIVGFCFTVQAVGLFCLMVVCAFCIRPTSEKPNAEAASEGEHSYGLDVSRQNNTQD